MVPPGRHFALAPLALAALQRRGLRLPRIIFMSASTRPQGDPRLRSMAHKVRLFNRHRHLPQSKPIRIGLGILLIVGGLVGFLPVLGFWMIPLGLLVLSVDLPIVRRWRRQLTVWWHRRKGETGQAPAAKNASDETVS